MYEGEEDRRQRDIAICKILALEATQMRTVREFLLGDQSALARLKTSNDQIVALRAQLVP